MLFTSILNRDSLNYINRTFTRVMEGSIAVQNQAIKIYFDGLNELISSPSTFTQRNVSFMKEIMTPPRPDWQTPHDIVELPKPLSNLAKLLNFTRPDVPSEGIIPTLFLPPQAGHHSYIADYSPKQSQVQTLRHTGLGGVYCMEWLSATPETMGSSIEHYIELIRYSIQKIGGKANLVGDCQGGWLATIYTALYPETVNTLSIAGAPIDFHAGNSQIKESLDFLSKNYPDNGMAFFRSLVAMGKGNYDGRIQLLAFAMMRPSQTPERYLNLYQNIFDEEEMERFHEMKNWFDFYQDISGSFYLWLVENLFRDNKLIHGQLVVGEKKVDMKNITCPIFMLAGTRDHITPPPQVFETEKYVGTPTENIHKYLVPAGHIGLFMGRDVLLKTWTVIGKQILEYSKTN